MHGEGLLCWSDEFGVCRYKGDPVPSEGLRLAAPRTGATDNDNRSFHTTSA